VNQADAQPVTKAGLKAEARETFGRLKRRLIGFLVAAVVIFLAGIKYL